jgi:hypothetical protein
MTSDAQKSIGARPPQFEHEPSVARISGTTRSISVVPLAVPDCIEGSERRNGEEPGA